MKKSNGFTILDLIITIAIFSIILSTVFVSLANFFNSNSLELMGTEMIHVIRKARSNSVNNLNDSNWGVYFNNADPENPDFIFFKGLSYESRDMDFDEIHELENSIIYQSIVLSGSGNEIVFEKNTGNALNIGTIEITQSNNTFIISINEIGKIEYTK